MTQEQVKRWQRIVGAKQDGQYGPKTVELSRDYLATLGIQLASERPTQELIETCEARLVLALAMNILE